MPEAPSSILLLLVAMPGAPCSVLWLLVAMPEAPSSVLLLLVAMPGAPCSVLLLLVAMPGAPCSVLLLLVAMPGAPCSVLLLLVAMPGAPCSVLLFLVAMASTIELVLPVRAQSASGRSDSHADTHGAGTSRHVQPPPTVLGQGQELQRSNPMTNGRRNGLDFRLDAKKRRTYIRTCFLRVTLFIHLYSSTLYSSILSRSEAKHGKKRSRKKNCSKASNKKLLGAPGLTIRSKDATRGSWPYY